MNDIVKIEPYLLLCQALTFLVALAILWKFAWGPLVGTIKERQSKIKDSVDSADRMRESVAKLEEEYKVKLQHIQEQTVAMVNKAREEATFARDEILSRAKQDAEAIRSRMQEQLERDRDLLAVQLRAEVVTLTMAVATKIIRDAEAGRLQASVVEELVAGMQKENIAGKVS